MQFQPNNTLHNLLTDIKGAQTIQFYKYKIE